MSKNIIETPSDLQSNSIHMLLINDSFKRLFYGNFEKLNCDLLIVVLFMFICVCSWQTTYYLLQYFNKKRWEKEQRNLSISSYSRSPNLATINSARISRSMSPARTISDQNNPVVDYRATGDGWENERHIDPEYDENSEMLLLLLNEADSIENEEQAEDIESTNSSEQNDGSILNQRLNAETRTSVVNGTSSTNHSLSNSISNETTQQNLGDN